MVIPLNNNHFEDKTVLIRFGVLSHDMVFFQRFIDGILYINTKVNTKLRNSLSYLNAISSTIDFASFLGFLHNLANGTLCIARYIVLSQLLFRGS